MDRMTTRVKERQKERKRKKQSLRERQRDWGKSRKRKNEQHSVKSVPTKKLQKGQKRKETVGE